MRRWRELVIRSVVMWCGFMSPSSVASLCLCRGVSRIKSDLCIGSVASLRLCRGVSRKGSVEGILVVLVLRAEVVGDNVWPGCLVCDAIQGCCFVFVSLLWDSVL